MGDVANGRLFLLFEMGTREGRGWDIERRTYVFVERYKSVGRSRRERKHLAGPYSREQQVQLVELGRQGLSSWVWASRGLVLERMYVHPDWTTCPQGGGCK